jgi:hypothetical protein
MLKKYFNIFLNKKNTFKMYLHHNTWDLKIMIKRGFWNISRHFFEKLLFISLVYLSFFGYFKKYIKYINYSRE